MIWILFFFTIFLNGIIIQSFFINKFTYLIKLALAFLFGSLFSIEYIYLLASLIFRRLDYAIIIYFLSTLILVILNRQQIIKSIKLIFSLPRLETVFVLISFIFSWYIFSKTFRYDVSSGEFLIASNVYLDFGVHIPFIRSFSLGNNFPFEVPFFAGKGLSYHFMFDLYAGILEFLGLRIDLAINLISSLSFTFLLIIIYTLSIHIFNRKSVGIIAILLFLFNTNFYFINIFLNFFKKSGLNFSLISSIWHNAFYSTVNISGINVIDNILNLNVFVNQRQLTFGILFFLFIFYLLLDLLKKEKAICKREIIIIGILIGFFPFWHNAVFLSISIVLCGFFLLIPDIRKNILVIVFALSIIAIPQILFINSHSNNETIFRPGFLLYQKLNLYNFILFWFLNLGLSIPLMIIGFLKAKRDNKKIFLIIFFIFLFANLFQFSKDIFDNHKLFNVWIIIINMFSAFAIVSLLKSIFKNQLIFKSLGVIVVCFITLPGFLNFLVLKNDVMTRIQDYTGNKFMTWISKNVENDSTVITNGEIYDPASLIGKKVFVGRTYFIYTYGGNPYERIHQKDTVFTSKNKIQIKSILNSNNIKYIILYKDNFAKNTQVTDLNFFKSHFRKIYEDKYGIVFKI